MNCNRLRQRWLDARAAEDPPSAEWAEHRDECASCTEFEREMDHAISMLRSSRLPGASPGLKPTVMARAAQIATEESRPGAPGNRSPWPRPAVLWPPLAVGAIALFVAAALLTEYARNRTFDRVPASALVADAFAAEQRMFRETGIVHIVDEILIPPVSDSVVASIRWLPLMEVRASGTPIADQLVLATPPGRRSDARDESWYDLGTGRFARVIVRDGRPVFGNGYDGVAVYSFSTESSTIERKPIAADFQPPAVAAGLLGMTAALPEGFERALPGEAKDVGRIRLWDGTTGRAVRVDLSDARRGDPLPYLVFKIRRKDHTLAEMEWRTASESWLVVRRIRSEKVSAPLLSWDLKEIERFRTVPAKSEPPALSILKDIVHADVTTQQMVEKAGFESYLVFPPPSWATEMHIMDILDLTAPPARMFGITYRATDGRHVVITQSRNQSEVLKPVLKWPVIYTSPSGNRLHTLPDPGQIAKPLLEGSRWITNEGAAKDCVGYLVETPSGTIVPLAVNGRVSDEELHLLVDHLVPARDVAGK